ncbi:MAG: hypothetical protein KF789_05305 [Bdellovibrionaceae bacterium]|nr:hypothetical protein [Pseudobdellovibrionaceae bacterium]
MKRGLSLLFLLSLSSLVACQGTNTEVVRERIEIQVPGAPEARSEGGVDSGGGNGYERKLLESYARDIRSSAAFQARILPILVNLTASYPRLASDLVHISQERRWYLIPGGLDRLPSQRIGVNFKTDQLALQNRGEVWINELLFNNLRSEEERAKLILHELVMGVRLMSYQDDLDECLSEVAILSLTSQEKSAYAKARKSCHHALSAIPGLKGGNRLSAPMKLTDPDYIAIRNLVSLLWETQGTVDAEELGAWMKHRNLRQY